MLCSVRTCRAAAGSEILYRFAFNREGVGHGGWRWLTLTMHHVSCEL
jgi:hypothetical protein